MGSLHILNNLWLLYSLQDPGSVHSLVDMHELALGPAQFQILALRFGEMDDFNEVAEDGEVLIFVILKWIGLNNGIAIM